MMQEPNNDLDLSIESKIQETVDNFKKNVQNRANLQKGDFEMISLNTFIELAKAELSKQNSADKLEDMESAFHSGMKRGHSLNMSLDERENDAKYHFTRAARKAYLEVTGDTIEAQQEFENLWKAAKNCYFF